ncbi:Histone-lysine N-methyltransferase SETMAR, partial [Habropoda laboriosa]
KLKNLSWEDLPYPPYSSDMALSDYYVFRNLNNFLRGKKFSNDEVTKTAIDTFFNSKPTEFFKRGIDHLVKLWQEIIKKGGNYIDD